MSPLKLEAAYEKLPAPPGSGGESAVRWGFRASYSAHAAEAADDAGPADAALPDGSGNGHLPRRGRPFVPGPRRGPRELPAEVPETCGASWLAYSRSGAPIPLDLAASTHTPGSGAFLDVRA